MQTAIKVENLTKSYGERQVLKGVSFSVPKGEIFALLGGNGAGKTTALECLEGIRSSDAGTYALAGTVGVQLQSSTLWSEIKAMEAVRFFAKWKKAAIDSPLLERLGIPAFQNQQYHKLSTGQKRRLHLAIALLGDPDILFLDEPTAGLDVAGQVALHEEIRQLKARGKTVILASHDMAEVAALCDRIAVLKQGEIVFLGTTAQLTGQSENNYRLRLRFAAKMEPAAFKSGILRQEDQEWLLFETQNLENALEELAAWSKVNHNPICDLNLEQDSLEQRFMDLTKEDV